VSAVAIQFPPVRHPSKHRGPVTSRQGWFEAGGDVDRVTVALRIAAADLDPDHITDRLGIAPSFSARRGETRKVGATEVVQRVGLWSYEIGSAEWTLRDGIAALLDRLPSDLAVWKQIVALGEVDLFCGLHLDTWNRGIDLPAAILGRLAERGIALSLDIYCSATSPETDA